MADSPINFFTMLPPEIDGWKKAGPPENYDRKNLFKYIDGGAELYISYGFEKLTAFRYVKGKDEEIKVDVFDMGNSYNAYGVFSHGREILGEKIGQGSEYSSGLLNFWKDCYYVSLLGYPEAIEKQRVILKLGAQISRIIPHEGPLPPILSLLPPNGLIEESIRYVHHHVWLNTYYFISNDNILLIDPQTEVILARYNGSQEKYILILIKYPNPPAAYTAEMSFLKNYMFDSSSGIKKLENSRFVGIRKNNLFLVLVLDAADSRTVEKVLTQATLRLR